MNEEHAAWCGINCQCGYESPPCRVCNCGHEERQRLREIAADLLASIGRAPS